MKRNVCCAVLALFVLPFLLHAGCGFSPATSSVHPNSYVCSCACEPAQRHRDLRIAFGADDAEQRLANTGFDVLLDSPDLDFLNGRYVGLRFRDVGIPANAGILHARVQFTAAPGSTTGALTVQIGGELTPNAPAFVATNGSLGALPPTVNSVAWNLPLAPWTTGDATPNQLTPDLAPVLQEIVKQPGWAEGNALVLLFRGSTGTGLRKAYTVEGRPAAAALLSIDYTEPLSTVEVLQHLDVCVPAAYNVKAGGTEATQDQLAADCSGRVQDTVTGLALTCHYPSLCSCTALPDTSVSKSSCDDDTGSGVGVCTASPVDPQCTNFDPPHGNVTATNAPGDEPVCAANSPLSAEMFGHRTSCDVEGTAHVKIGDDEKTSHTQGTLQFTGNICPGQSCAVGMQYRLNIDPVTFGNFFHSETFSDLGGLGETRAGAEALLSAGGDGSFASNAAPISAEGRRGGGDLKGLTTSNADAVNVNVFWGAVMPTCSLNGALIGSVDPELKQCSEGPDTGKVCETDADCTQDDGCSDQVCNCESVADQAMTLTLEVAGNITNQPPTADAGDDQDVECSAAAVTSIFLDARGSSDLDGNIVLYSWMRGSRVGPEVGFDPVSQVEQSLGSQMYVLRVIDAFGQSDEATTSVDVVDTTPPVLSCSVLTPVLNQTNHNLVNVGLSASAVDQCEGELPVEVKVFADEDDDDNGGDGHFSPDATDLAVGTLRLRAERKGNGDGRVYLIIPEAIDSSGNRGFSCCTVTVPHSSAASAQASAMAQAAAARAFCGDHGGSAPPDYFVVGDGPVVGPKQ